MDVKRDNFTPLTYDVIKSSIDGAAFVAIDTEFTTLVPSDLDDSSLLDDSAVRYEKLRKSCSQGALVQFGMSVFRTDEPIQTLDQCLDREMNVRSFNIWLFPRTVKEFEAMTPNVFICQASSIEFLACHGFDFNQSFRDGLGFVTRRQKKLLSKIIANEEHYINDDIHLIITKWKDDLSAGETLSISVPYNRTAHLLANKISKHYKLKSTVVESAMRNEIVLNRREIIEDTAPVDLLSICGLSSVIELISKSRIPVIVHNGIMDFMYLAHNCIDPLPSNYHRFKKMIRSKFPLIFDTKHIMSELQERNALSTSIKTNLGALYKSLCQQNDVKIDGLTQLKLSENVGSDEQFAYHRLFNADPKKSAGKAHDAGFDAFMCGSVFVQLLKVSKLCNVDLNGIANKINLIKALSPYADLTRGLDPIHTISTHDMYVKNAFSQRKLDHIFTPFEFELVNRNDPLAQYAHLLVRCGKEGRDHLVKKWAKQHLLLHTQNPTNERGKVYEMVSSVVREFVKRKSFKKVISHVVVAFAAFAITRFYTSNSSTSKQ